MYRIYTTIISAKKQRIVQSMSGRLFIIKSLIFLPKNNIINCFKLLFKKSFYKFNLVDYFHQFGQLFKQLFKFLTKVVKSITYVI